MSDNNRKIAIDCQWKLLHFNRKNVILLMAALWTIHCYASPEGVDEIRAWHDRQSRQIQAKFLSRLRTLVQASGSFDSACGEEI